MSEKIIVTGSNGKLGQHLINFLLHHYPPEKIVALVTESEKGKDLTAKGIEFRIGNYFDLNSLTNAFQGINKVILISSSDLNERAKQHGNVIVAARKAQVDHIYYTSLLLNNVSNEAVTILELGHKETEQHLESSGLKYTIFRNGMYFDMILKLIGEEFYNKTDLRVPVGIEKACFTDRKDIAEGMAQVISNGASQNVIDLVTNHPVSFMEIAKLTGHCLNHLVTYTNISIEEFKAGLISQHKSSKAIEESLALAKMIREKHVDCSGSELESLLKRKPMTIKEYLESRIYH